MRRCLALILAAWALPAAPAIAQWGEAPLAGAEGERCGSVAGDGWIAALDRRARAVVLWRTGPNGAAAEAGRLALPAAAFSCPVVSVAADGSALVAVEVLRPQRRLLIARRRGAGPLALTAQIRVDGRTSVLAGAAAAPGGSGVVVWSESRYRNPGARVAVTATRFTAGADIALSPEQLVAPTDVREDFVDPLVAAGVDAAGGAVVAWTVPRPAQRRGRVSGLAALDVAIAPPEAPFGAARRVMEDRQDVADLALAVAPDGRALLAHDGTGGVEVHERAPGGAFAPLVTYGVVPDAPPTARRPAVALAADGSAIVAFRNGDGIDVAMRAGAGPLAAPVTVGRDTRALRGLGFGFGVGFGGRPRVMRDEESVDAVVVPGGDAVVTWLAAAAHRGGPYHAEVATSKRGTFGSSAVVGGVVREVRAVAPLLDAAGPGVLWADDRGTDFSDGAGDALLHLARPGLALQDPPPPSVEVAGHRRALFPTQPLRLVLRCPASCEVRASIPPRRESGDRSVAVGGRRGAGRVTLLLRPSETPQLARRSGVLPVVLDAAAPGGARATHRTVRLAVRRRPLPPFRAPLDLAARRRGDDVVVTWRTDGPARRMTYVVATKRGAEGSVRPDTVADVVKGRARTRFRVRLREVPAAHRHVVFSAGQVTREDGRVIRIR